MSFTQNIKIFILQAANFGCFEPTAGLSKHKDTQNVFLYLYSGIRGCVVGIATAYGLDGSGIESR